LTWAGVSDEHTEVDLKLWHDGLILRSVHAAGPRNRSDGRWLSVVGTHFPDDRDVLESALQRMREAFDALRDRGLPPGLAEEEFLAGYDTARDMIGAFFLTRSGSAEHGPFEHGPFERGPSENGPFECAAIVLPACLAVLRRLTEDDLSRPTPCTEYTVSEVGQHVLRSMVLLASVAGQEIECPAAGTLEEQVAATTESALAAWRRRGLDGSVAVGRSTLPASLAIEIITLELLVHGWDITRATGQDIDVPAWVAGHVLARARELITEDKRGRGFAAEVPAGPAASAMHRLIAFTGREP
jgi:uncharacterized protein (TIGR03086 family)